LPFELKAGKIKEDGSLGPFTEQDLEHSPTSRVKFNFLVIQCFIISKVLVKLLKPRAQSILMALLTEVVYEAYRLEIRALIQGNELELKNWLFNSLATQEYSSFTYPEV
jgi:hypothetical protein